MIYKLEDINRRVETDPAAFAKECDAYYDSQLEKAAAGIAANLPESPIVLLTGPSGSGKTTTAGKLEKKLEALGIGTYIFSMDDYFLDVKDGLTPRAPDGSFDLESPLCLDMDLLNDHFTKLSRGEEITLPKFDFGTQSRSPEKGETVRLEKNQVAIFEGIHALNDSITDVHPEAYKIFVSADSGVDTGREYHRRWARLLRRVVRDARFRHAPATVTMERYKNIRRGEKLYILPYVPKADITLDSFHAYELAVFASFAIPELEAAGDDQLDTIVETLRLFRPMDREFVPEDSLIREFIG